jgi:hypothetical protein
MLVLLHEQQTGCRFFRQVGIECGLSRDLPTMEVLQYLVGAATMDEPSTLHRLQTISENVLADTRLVSDVNISVALSVQRALQPTPEHPGVDLTVWENIRKHTMRRYALYIQDPLLYELGVSLQHGLTMKDALDAFPCDRTKPSLLELWATWIPRTTDSSATLLSRSHSFALLRDGVQKDACYPYLRQMLHREMDQIRINLLNELYLSYTTFSSSDLHHILVHLDLSVGLQSLVADCTRPQVAVGISSTDVLLICLCLLLVGSISLSIVNRYRTK